VGLGNYYWNAALGFRYEPVDHRGSSGCGPPGPDLNGVCLREENFATGTGTAVPTQAFGFRFGVVLPQVSSDRLVFTIRRVRFGGLGGDMHFAQSYWRAQIPSNA
jgi:hypothetical protein